jgi:hypothetical protein
MKPSHIVLALSMVSVVSSAALAQAPDPHHPPGVAAPADTHRDQPVAPQASPQQPAQPGQMPQGGMMMNCPMMQGGQTQPSATMNCGMMQGHMQSGQTPPQAPETTR